MTGALGGDHVAGDEPRLRHGPSDLFDHRDHLRLVTVRGVDHDNVRPGVDLDRLADTDPDLAAWMRERLRPKVLLATQTRVLEVVVDPDGSMVPSTPVVAVHAPADQLWSVAAVLAAPSTAAWALARVAGAGLHPDAIKLSASQVGSVPLPTNRRAWEQGARLARDVAAASDATGWHDALVRFGLVMVEAYGASQDVYRWWLDRLPPFR